MRLGCRLEDKELRVQGLGPEGSDARAFLKPPPAPKGLLNYGGQKVVTPGLGGILGDFWVEGKLHSIPFGTLIARIILTIWYVSVTINFLKFPKP